MTTQTTIEARRPSLPALSWVAPCLGVLILVVVLYGRVFQGLVTVWSQVSYFSYGFLVPLWSAWLAVGAASRVASAPKRRDLWGVPIVGVGLLALAVADAHGNLALAALSLPVVLIGLGRLTLGREAFRPLAFPVAFLALMAPLPPHVVPPLSLFLQRLAAGFSELVVHAVGVPLIRDDLFLHVGGVTLFVAEACNGLRFLLAMVVLGVAFAWAVDRGPGCRLLVFAAAVAGALVANLIRVSGTALLVHVWGPAAAVGNAHNVFGKTVYLIVLALCLVLVWRLRPPRPGPGNSPAEPGESLAPPSSRPPRAS